MPSKEEQVFLDTFYLLVLMYAKKLTSFLAKETWPKVMVTPSGLCIHLYKLE